jgi:hypothetical protein
MSPFAAELRRSPGSAIAVVAAIAGVLAPVALVGAFFARVVAAWLPVTGGSAILLLALAAIGFRLAPAATFRPLARLGPRAGIAVGLGLAALAPVYLLGSLVALSEPIVQAHWRCGTGDVALAMFAPFVVGGWAFAAVLAAFLIVGDHARPWVDRAVRGLAVLASAVAIGVAAWGAARLRLPEPDRWVETRPIVATIPPSAWKNLRDAPAQVQPGQAGSSSASSGTDTAGATDAKPPHRTLEDVALLGRTLHRVCVEVHCTIGWSDAPTQHGDLDVERDDELQIRRDAASGIVLIAPARAPDIVRALDERGVRGLGPRDLRDQLGPPRAWLAFAAIGAALSVALLASAARRAIAARRPPAAVRVAWVRAGQLELEDGDRWPAPPALLALGVRDGDVITVLPAGRDGVRTYRVHGAPDFGAFAGSPAEYDAHRHARATSHAAFALASACLLCAPMLAVLRELR